MTHEYRLTVVTCVSCESKVKTSILSINNIFDVEISKDKNYIIITMDKIIAT